MSKISDHQNSVNWQTVRKQELDDILDWLDEDVDSYVRFLAWRQIRDAYKQAEDDWSERQNNLEEPDYDI